MDKILDANSPVATVLGGSGFVGKYVVRRLVKRGWRVRVAVRSPNEALFLKTYGEVGQVEVFKCSIFDSNALSKCILGSRLVINAVAGLLNETSKKIINRYYIEGPELLASICTELKVAKLIHISAVGVDKQSRSLYSSAKAKGEDKLREKFANAAIVRPSLIFGHEDRFFNRYASLATYSPFLPLIGKSTQFQPVYVDDVALAIEKIATEKELIGIFELGGPEILTFEKLIKKMLFVIRRNRLILTIPFGIANLMATVFELIQNLSFGLLPLPFSKDNVQQLRNHNIVFEGNNSFNDLGIKPKDIDTIIPLYLYSYRPHGQFNDITNSAKK
tara:strand:- start:2440 stop:3435 length:996 start_codon:yes stop_codon:yes gene_type:complete